VAKILVADDNSNIQKMVGLALKDQGIDVVAVGNGEAAVRKISDIKPDLVLADVFMPVRNGYEVCRYVKEDSALAHIPVILLVGAFDPLDEQEAQRSGADGVLKKPFVPPDPLISMVKSALVRAGVPLGAPTSEEKVPPPPKRTTADILGGAVTSSKIAALSGEKLPEVTPEPVEEFPSPMPRLKIAAGNQPVAFGSLLETPETAENEAEDLSVTAKPMIDLRHESKWEDSDEVEEEKEEEEEEESAKGGWRPGGMDEEVERGAKSSQVSDWREEAFHGNSPAKNFSSSHWTPSVEPPAFSEAAEAPSVAVATAETKPAESPLPFSSDAWAAAMAAGVEEKLGEIKDAAPVVNEADAVPAAHEGSVEQAREVAPAVQEPAHVETAGITESVHTEQAAEPANWAAAPETAWELEAKKASLLAATWDAPAFATSLEETQEIPAYSAEPQVEHAEQAAEEPAETTSHYSSEPVVSGEAVEPVRAETVVEQPEIREEREEEVANTSVIEAPAADVEPKSWENAWEAPTVAQEPTAPVVTAEQPVAEPAAVEETIVEKVLAQESYASEPGAEPVPPAPVEEAAVPEPIVTASTPAAPDMDELVNRVLGKMNPEVLQRVTREILKPMIEAIVRDELGRKG
jgi:CheY-like chemotaxis protein